MKAMLLGFLAAAVSAGAQDATTIAIQQNETASQISTQASQQAMAEGSRASEQASRDMHNGMRDANQYAGDTIAVTRQPKFSEDSGTLAAGSTVRITCPSHYATIYYTTDGWTPTTASPKYTGPIAIDHNTLLQAIAIAPHMTRSLVAHAVYTVPGSKPPAPASALVTDGVLRAGAQLQLATVGQANSKTAQVGDKLALRLDQDIVVGDRVVVPKGTPVEASITSADRSGHIGIPGDLVFTVKALSANGITIPLRGGATLEGDNRYMRAVKWMIVPVVGSAGLAARGGEAEIVPNMMLSVEVAADTPLMPAASRQ